MKKISLIIIMFFSTTTITRCLAKLPSADTMLSTHIIAKIVSWRKTTELCLAYYNNKTSDTKYSISCEDLLDLYKVGCSLKELAHQAPQIWTEDETYLCDELKKILREHQLIS